MQPKVLIGILLAVGAAAIGSITIYGKMQADASAAATQVGHGVTPQAAPDRTEEIWVNSDPCRLTSGTDAQQFCDGIPEKWKDNPDIDMAAAEERASNVRQCAVDALVKIHRLDSPDRVRDEQVIELLCGLVEHFSESSDDPGVSNLQAGMYDLMNQYVNR